MAILPLGTGNDLARELGWGGGGRRGAHTRLVELLTDVERAQVTLLDRWTVRFGDARIGRRTNSDPPPRTLQNYMGIGVDAKARTSCLLLAYSLLAWSPEQVRLGDRRRRKADHTARVRKISS